MDCLVDVYLKILERRYNVRGVQALSRKAVFGIFIQLFESINMVAIHSYDKMTGSLLEYGTEHNILEAYKQIISLRMFPLPSGCDLA